MVADAFDDGLGAAVADAEAFADHAADVKFTGDCAVGDDVAGDDIFICLERAVFGGKTAIRPPRQAFADIVVGVSFQKKRYAAGAESSRSSGRPIR